MPATDGAPVDAHVIAADFRRPRFVLAVPDAQATAAWWVDAMGFARILEVPGRVFVRRCDCIIHLGSCPDALPPRDLGDHSYFGYIEVDSIDALHAEISANGVTILSPPADKPWGMREMAVRTPDGHRVMFGQPAPKT